MRIVVELSDNLNIDLISKLFSVNAKLDNLLYCADFTVTFKLTLCILHQIFEDITSKIHILGIKHVNM